MITYELLTITPALTAAGESAESSQLFSFIEKLIKKSDGEIKSKNDWGEITFKYPIQKHEKGVYTLWEVALNPDQVSALRRELNIQEELLRSMIIRKS